MSNTKNKIPTTKRICVLDELRGVAVIAMVLYHTVYSMAFVFNLPFSYPIMKAVQPYQPIIPIVFITLCGISCSFSRNNLKRGIILLGISITVTLVTALILPSQLIVFGILHFLSIAIIIYAVLSKPISKIPVTFGLLFSIILFILTYNIPRGYIGFDSLVIFELPEQLYQFYPLFIIGLPSIDFYSADYFPVIPYIFLCISGVFCGRFIAAKGVPKWTYKKYCPPLDFVGRHALIIYILHQPIIIGILFLVTKFI